MGANTSKQRYEYSYGDPAQNYNRYANNQRGRGYTQSAPYYGQAPGMMPTGYPAMYPQSQASQQKPQIIFPLLMHPMQQVSGPPVGQLQQQQSALQPQMQQQQYMQMPQPQAQPMLGNQMPPNPMPPLPIAQMPQPQMPQPDVQPFGRPQPQPQSQYPLTPGPPNGMPEASAANYRQGPGMPGSTPVIPRSFAREPSSSTSSSTSSSSSTGGGITDRMANNPLPAPPREAETPAHLLAGSAMTHSFPPPPRSSSPLKNPLPPLPRDVYTLKKYRPLLVGSAYTDRQKEVYPEGWFSEGHRREHDGNLGRVFERLNPFRPNRGPEYTPGHRRYDTMPELPQLPEFIRENSSGSGSESSFASQGMRRAGLGRSFTSRMPFGRRRRGNEQMMPSPMGGPLPPVAEGQAPPIGFMPMPTPQVPGPETQPQPMQPLSPAPPQSQSGNPLTPGPPQPMPQPAHPLSPLLVPPIFAGQGPASPNPDSSPTVIRFDQRTPGYGGLCHLSPHCVLYKKKLYPTAAHLFEAHKFLGMHDDLAERVRKTRSLPELDAILQGISGYTRHDWEEILYDKMEDVLYLKLKQHEDLRELLLNTGIADIVYAEASDTFWGEGEHGEGANELGRALMRIRERLRRETVGN